MTICENAAPSHPIICIGQHNGAVVMRFQQQQGVSECQVDILLNRGYIHWRLLNARQIFQCSARLTHQAVIVVQRLRRLIPMDHPVWLSGRPVRLPTYLALTCTSYLDCVWMRFIRITFGPDINIPLGDADYNQMTLFLSSLLLLIIFKSRTKLEKSGHINLFFFVPLLLLHKSLLWLYVLFGVLLWIKAEEAIYSIVAGNSLNWKK